MIRMLAVHCNGMRGIRFHEVPCSQSLRSYNGANRASAFQYRVHGRLNLLHAGAWLHGFVLMPPSVLHTTVSGAFVLCTLTIVHTRLHHEDVAVNVASAADRQNEALPHYPCELVYQRNYRPSIW